MITGDLIVKQRDWSKIIAILCMSLGAVLSVGTMILIIIDHFKHP